ncbi:MAG: M14 family zinc carboxypeptidase [Bacteroidota bacterium]
MNRKSLVFILLILFAFAKVNTQAQERKESYFSFPYSSRIQLDTLTRWMSIDHISNKNVYAYATPEQWKKLQRTDLLIQPLPLPSEFRQKEGSIIMASIPNEMSSWDKYPTYGCYQALMEKFANEPMCNVYSIGKSVEDRELYMAEITGSFKHKTSKPGIFLTSTMHGDETTGYILMLRLIDSLLQGYVNSPEIKALLDSNVIYINPLANPDGTYRTGNHTVEGASRYNANMVDLNRNFPDPTGDPHPDSQPHQLESKAMMKWTETTPITLAANFHGGAEVVNYPWDVVEHLHPDNYWFIDASLAYASNAQSNSPEGYFTSVNTTGITNGYQWYQVFGSRQDYMNYHRQIRELTIEVSTTKLMPSALLPEMWQYNKEALFSFMEYSKWGVFGFVTDTAGKAIEAEIFLNNYDTREDSSMIFTRKETGYFARLLNAGTYTLKAKAPWYRDTTITGIPLAKKERRYLNITLVPLDTVAFAGTLYSAVNGGALPNAFIQLQGENKSYQQFTNSEGEFYFHQLPAQAYQLTLKAQGHEKYSTSLSLEKSEINYAHTMQSEEAIYFEATGKVTDVINGKPIEGANVQFWYTNLLVNEAATNSQGAFQLPMLERGRYHIKLLHSSYKTIDTLLWVDEEQNNLIFTMKKTQNTYAPLFRNKDLSIFPNPSQGDLNIRFPFSPAQTYSVTIYTLQGEEKYHVEATGSSLSPINTQSLSPGLYLIVLNSNKEKLSALFFKE